MSISFSEFRQIGREQWYVQSSPARKVFVRLFGPLGVHARIRNARVINKIKNFDLPDTAKILDMGCGHAYATFWLGKRFPSYQFDALESDIKLVEDGRKICEYLDLTNVNFIHQDAGEFTSVNEYDLIFSIDMLEHIEDDVSILQSMYHSLKGDGTLLLHLPRRHQEHWRFIPAFKNHTTPDHVRDEYTAEEINEKLRSVGFQPTQVQYGFSRTGEIAFELNYLFWNWNSLRVFTAILFHPISVILAYLDIRQNYSDGNTLLITAKKERNQGLHKQ